MCVYNRHVKKPVPVYIDYTLGEYMHKKRLIGRSFFRTQVLRVGVRIRKPRQEFKGNALKLFFYVVLRQNGALIK